MAEAKLGRGRRPPKKAAPVRPAREPFWRNGLEALTKTQWESLCDGCGRCCLVKLEDEDTARIHFTSIACKLLQPATCRCADYGHRSRRVHDCLRLTPQTVRTLSWLPPTCAYRLVAEGKDLSWWHPLVSGSPETVHEAGVSVRGRIEASEDDVPLANFPDFIVLWPGRAPKRARGRRVGETGERPPSATSDGLPRRPASRAPRNGDVPSAAQPLTRGAPSAEIGGSVRPAPCPEGPAYGKPAARVRMEHLRK